MFISAKIKLLLFKSKSLESYVNMYNTYRHPYTYLNLYLKECFYSMPKSHLDLYILTANKWADIEKSSTYHD